MKKKESKFSKKVLKYVLILLLSLVVVTGILFLSVYLGAFGPLPNQKELSSIRNEEASLVFSSDNSIIGKFFAENRTNIKQEDIPEHLKNALIATEDRRFFNHKGYDILSYFRVLLKSIILQDNSGGGSTLTQQLVKNLYGRKSYSFLTLPVNKIKEIIIASRLEKIYTKEELLVLYLNSVPFGEDVYGVESAARRFFSKPAKKLRIEESAVLIGMLKANTTYNPVLNPASSRARRDVVISLMKKEKFLTAAQADSLKKLPLKVNYEKNHSSAAYFVEQVRKKTVELLDSINDATGKDYNLERDGLKIYTTLNSKIQDAAEKAISNHLSAMQKLLDRELENRRARKQWLAKQRHVSKEDSRKREIRIFDWDGTETKNISRIDSLWHYYKMLNGAVLITDPKSGEVITWIGGNNFQILPFDMVLSHRQIASAFKPVLYASALEKGMDPCMYLENTETKYEGYENWEPENYDKESTADSTVAFWYALTHSMNLPSVDLYFKLGKDNLINTCEELEFPELPKGPSAALGSLDLSLYEIVRTYASFANHGQMTDLVMIRKITDSKGKVLYKAKPSGSVHVFDTTTCNMITAILQQVISSGTGAGIRSRFGIRSDLAGKTGTAQNYSDAWFIAYTPRLVIGTWVGASTPDIHFNNGNGSGASLAMPIAGNVLKYIENSPDLKNKYLTPFGLPGDVYAFLQCNPYHETGVKGFFDRLFGKNGEKPDTIAQTEKKEERKENGIRALIRRIFKGE